MGRTIRQIDVRIRGLPVSTTSNALSEYNAVVLSAIRHTGNAPKNTTWRGGAWIQILHWMPQTIRRFYLSCGRPEGSTLTQRAPSKRSACYPSLLGGQRQNRASDSLRPQGQHDRGRLGCSLQDLVATLNDLQAVGCDLYLHQQALDTSTPSGRAMFQMCGVFAEFERSMIRERVNAGLARARSKGIKLGHRKVQSSVEEQIQELRQGGMGILKIGKTLGVTPYSNATPSGSFSANQTSAASAFAKTLR